MQVLPFVDVSDPDVLAALRRITDRFLKLGKATPKHDIKVKLGSKRHVLDTLEREGFIQTLSDSYLPGICAEELEDSAIRDLIRSSTGVVLLALRQLYEGGGPKQYSAEEIRTKALVGIEPTATPEMVTIGLLFAVGLGKYFSSWAYSPDGAPTSVTPREEIIDF